MICNNNPELKCNKDTYRGQSGFTIVELMIVVAIAGLILVLVLVAAPALQRNGRDLTRRADATALSGQIAQYLASNGELPDDKDKLKVVTDDLQLGHYTSTTGTVVKDPSAGVCTKLAGEICVGPITATAVAGFHDNTTKLPEIDTLHMVKGGKCGTLKEGQESDGTTAGTVDGYYDIGAIATHDIDVASHRQYVIVFQIESEGGKYVCLDA